MGSILPTVISISAGLVIGIIGFFLKQTINKVNNCVMRDDFNKAITVCNEDIKSIKEDYITKEDFYREQSKVDRKLDKIMDILLEMKGGNKNGQ